MPCVVRDGTFSVYVYANDHNPPHCHILWNAGEKVGAADLETLAVSAGDTPPKRGIKLIRNSIDQIRRKWNELHPGDEIDLEE